MSRLSRTLSVAALGAGAALYFLPTVGQTLEWLDEGMIVHASWRAARGELPYVDFSHVYGPSLFLVNGALFRLFGEDLHVIRLCLVALKALIVVETYLLARTVASRLAALVATVLLIAAWGTPLWLFNVPYATYYGTPLCFAGLLLLLSERETRSRLLLAGMTFGVAATFKQTQGLFACLSAVLLVVGSAPAGDARRGGAALALLALVAVAGVTLAYVGERLATATAVLTVVPLLACCAVLAWRTARRGSGDVGTLFGRLLALATGMAIPLAVCAAFYARRGALGALVFDTLAGLPQRISWFVPFYLPSPSEACFGGVVLASVTLAATRATWVRRAAAATLAVSGVLLAVLVGRGRGFRSYLLDWLWPSDFFTLLPWMPFVLLTVAAVALARGPYAGSRALQLLVFVAAGAVLQLHPCADIPHVLMNLPAFVPLLAFAIAPAASEGRRPAAVALAVLWTLSATLPFTGLRRDARPPITPPFARATGVTDRDPVFADAGELVRALPAIGGARPLLVTSEERLLYFLADAPPALPRDEFMLYLVGADLIRPADARAISDEDAMIAALAATRPVAVERTGSIAAVRVRATFPRLARWLDDRYAPVRTVGPYRVRLPRDVDDAPVDSAPSPRLDAPRPTPAPSTQ